MDKLSTWISILIFIIIPLINYLLSKKKKQEEEESPVRRPVPVFSESDEDDWYGNYKSVKTEDEKILTELYSSNERMPKMKENEEMKASILRNTKPMSSNIDSQDSGIGHQHLFETNDDIKKAFIVSEILKRNF